MKKLLLAIFLAITILYIIPLEASAGETGTFFSVQYTSGYGHGGGHYKAGYGHGYGRGHYKRHRHYYRGHHHHGHRYFWSGSIVIPWYPYGYPASPPVVIQKEPQVYVQPKQGEENYWYYCPDPQGYYPYIQECASGWMKVVPDATPPNQ